MSHAGAAPQAVVPNNPYGRTKRCRVAPPTGSTATPDHEEGRQWPSDSKRTLVLG
jgi:hypothetical protein